MTESLVNGYRHGGFTAEALGKAEKTAALFSLLGSDWDRNIHTIVSQTRSILEADFCIYLTMDNLLVADGWSPEGEAPSLLTPWAMTLMQHPAEDGLILLGRESLPLELNCRLIAGIPVMADDQAVGLLAAGFETIRGFGPDDFHAARCLASALGLQHRIKANEQAVQTSHMARQVAHDLNNILAGLVSYPELLLLQLEDTSPLKGPISLMHDSGVQAAEIIHDFLILARPPDSGPVFSISPSASALAFGQTAAYAALSQAFPLARFIFNIQPDLPDIRGTEGLIPKLLSGLLPFSAGNLSGPGQVKVSMTQTLATPEATPCRNTDRKWILLRVEDNGTPTDEKDLRHLFDPFYTKKVMGRQGSGLELPAVKKLVQWQGGLIRTARLRDRGNRFDIYFSVA